MDERFIEAAEAFEASKREAAIAEIRSRKPTLEPKGICHNCEAPLDEDRLYCDKACAEEHEWVMDRKRQNARGF